MMVAHYFRSNNGRILFITSFDCYCSVITFSEGELGIQLADSKRPSHLLTESKVKNPPVNLKELVKDGHSEKKISNLELKGTPSPSKVDSAQNPPQSSGKTPRRIRPTQLESYSSPSKENSMTPPLSSPIAPPTSHASAASCSVPPSVSCATVPSASLPTASSTANPSDRGKNEGPRRVSFVTLAKFNDGKEEGQTPPKCSKEPHDRTDSTHIKETGEPMEVQTSE